MKNTLLILFLVIYISPIFSQQSRLSKGVNYLSEFIASNYFKSLKNNYNDLSLVDTIYLRALKNNEYNYSEALLSLTFATVPYKEVPIKFPVFNFIVHYPLISADDTIYLLKNKNLPKNLFFDSPHNNFGDKDKLAHFFGSAFISYSSNIFDLGYLIGYFVEVFEEEFKVQSAIDPRDLDADNLGVLFGKMLKLDKDILPSKILIIHLLLYSRFIL